MAREKKVKNIDEMFQELDDLIKELEKEDITLEESFALYSTGMKTIQSCNEKVETIEKKVLQLNEKGETDEF